jgi:hypothetical protein
MKALTEIHEFKKSETKIGKRIEFYVRTDKGINRGSVMVADNKIFSVHFVKDNPWLSRPYLVFGTKKKKNGNVIVTMKGGNDKEAMHIFTINPGSPDFIIKTN